MREKDTFEDRRFRSFFQEFYRWYGDAQGVRQQCSRGRVLLVCLLIRFAGLRLGEVLALDDMKDIDEATSEIYVRGKWARVVPLPRNALKKLLELRDAPCMVRERGRICRLDPGYVRRIFSLRAQKAGLYGVNPSDVRSFREKELLLSGLPLPVVEQMLGRQGREPLNGSDREQIHAVLQQWESERQSGRHNSLKGVIRSLNKGSFSCMLEVAGWPGTVFSIQSTTRTVTRLGLEVGMEVTVSVRTLQVEVLPRAVRETNCFCARVTDILEGAGECRILLQVQENGPEFCSVLPRTQLEKLSLERGSQTWVYIRPADFTLNCPCFSPR